MRSFAIEEPGFPVPALYATLDVGDMRDENENSELPTSNEP